MSGRTAPRRGHLAAVTRAGAAKKRFGQHFLEPAWAAKVIRLIDPQPDEVFLEVGPGRGALTIPLAARSQWVIAYEIDRDLACGLSTAAAPNVTVIEGDFLEQPFTWPFRPEPRVTMHAPATNPESRIPNPDGVRLRVAANLPYNVASPILFRLIRLFDSGVPFADATLMLQREVADRLLAEPGSKDYGVLTVLVRHSATVDRLLDLPPGAFRPPPKVRSSVVRVTFHEPQPPVRNREVFTALVRAVFTRRRKTIANALQAYRPARPPVAPPWLDPRRRPETLSIDEFARLADECAT